MTFRFSPRSHPRLGIVLLAALVAGACLAPAPCPAATPQLWFYLSRNLWVDDNLKEIETLFRRASAAGYTHVLLTDSKFGKLGDMDARYFRNLDRVKQRAQELHLEIVPALFSVGYSNDLLWHDPNLIEALPARTVPLVVAGGVARLQPDPKAQLRGGDFSDLKLWDWKDDCVTGDAGAARVTDPKGRNARIVQRLALSPFRQYHLSVRVKTADFRGAPEVKVLAGNHALNFNSLGVHPTQDWTLHHVVFNSLQYTQAQLYLGCWDGRTGSLWWDDAQLEEVAFVNLVRRDGAPLQIRTDDGRLLREGTDFEPLTDPLMGTRPWKGSYDVWHEPPRLRATVPDGTRLRADYHHAVTVYEDQAMICPSEPRTVELLRDQARRMHAAWGARGYMMSHDEIRVLNWCTACQQRKLDAGAILADNVRTCVRILKEVNPGGTIYVWSDMFDPHHNATTNYYLVRGDLRGSWEGLDRDVIVVPWYFEKRAESLRWFAERGHRQLMAGYYDGVPEQVRDWSSAAAQVEGVLGVMYTTWQNRYADLERFAELARQP